MMKYIPSFLRLWETNNPFLRQKKGFLRSPGNSSEAAAAVVGVVAATSAATSTAAIIAAAVPAITEEDYDENYEPENAVVITTVAKHDCSLSPHLRFLQWLCPTVRMGTEHFRCRV